MNNGVVLGTVTADDFSMDYMKFGHGDKTMVIIPGLSVDSVMKYFEAVAGAYAQMTDDFTIYLFDRRKDLPERERSQDRIAEPGSEPWHRYGSSAFHAGRCHDGLRKHYSR